MNFKKLSNKFKIIMIRSKSISLETFNILILVRRFLSRHLDIRTILKKGIYVFEKFKGVYGFNIKAYGRFARRGRAFEIKFSRGFDVNRRYDISGDYASLNLALNFGIGCIKAIFFRKPNYFFKNFIFFSSKNLNSLKS